MSDKIDKIFAGRMSQDDLNRLIKMHEDYINGIKGGRRLILQFMNLSGLSFAKRNLSDAVLTGSAPAALWPPASAGKKRRPRICRTI